MIFIVAESPDSPQQSILKDLYEGYDDIPLCIECYGKIEEYLSTKDLVEKVMQLEMDAGGTDAGFGFFKAALENQWTDIVSSNNPNLSAEKQSHFFNRGYQFAYFAYLDLKYIEGRFEDSESYTEDIFFKLVDKADKITPNIYEDSNYNTIADIIRSDGKTARVRGLEDRLGELKEYKKQQEAEPDYKSRLSYYESRIKDLKKTTVELFILVFLSAALFFVAYARPAIKEYENKYDQMETQINQFEKDINTALEDVKEVKKKATQASDNIEKAMKKIDKIEEAAAKAEESLEEMEKGMDKFNKAYEHFKKMFKWQDDEEKK